MKLLFLLFGLAAAALADEVHEESHTLKLDEEVNIASINYPDDAPAYLKQTWKLSTSEDNVIQITCTDIRLFEEKPCGDWALVIKDGDKTEELCTSIFDYSKTSETNELELHMRTGKDARGFLNCTAKAIKKN